MLNRDMLNTANRDEDDYSLAFLRDPLLHQLDDDVDDYDDDNTELEFKRSTTTARDGTPEILVHDAEQEQLYRDVAKGTSFPWQISSSLFNFKQNPQDSSYTPLPSMSTQPEPMAQATATAEPNGKETLAGNLEKKSGARTHDVEADDDMKGLDAVEQKMILVNRVLNSQGMGRYQVSLCFS
jgi:hypothetical protein